MLLKFFGSVKLTLALLLGLAAVSVFGTLKTLPNNRYDLFYQSPWFRLLLALLALNLAVCATRTILRNLRDLHRFREILRGEQIFAVPLRYVLPRDTRPEELTAALQARGYRVTAVDGAVVGRRGLAGRWGSTLVHLSVLGIMIGALSSELGFVGTVNLYVGDSTDSYFDWEDQDDRPLGFTFRLDDFEPLYYPIAVQFAAVDPVTGRTLETYTSREGETVALPAPGLTAEIVKFLPFEEQLILGLRRGGDYLGEYFAVSGKQGQIVSPVELGFELRPLAFKDPQLKQLQSRVSILDHGKVVRRGEILINHPLVFEGVAVYQITFDRDKFGFWSAGFQVTRDPGEPAVWAGSILLVLGLLLAFVVPYRVVGIGEVDGETLLVALAGFRGEAGSRDFDLLERGLGDQLAVSGQEGMD